MTLKHPRCLFVSLSKISLRSQSLSKLYFVTIAEFHDNYKVRFGHEHMSVDSKNSYDLTVEFFYELFHPVVLC